MNSQRLNCKFRKNKILICSLPPLLLVAIAIPGSIIFVGLKKKHSGQSIVTTHGTSSTRSYQQSTNSSLRHSSAASTTVPEESKQNRRLAELAKESGLEEFVIHCGVNKSVPDISTKTLQQLSKFKKLYTSDTLTYLAEVQAQHLLIAEVLQRTDPVVYDMRLLLPVVEIARTEDIQRARELAKAAIKRVGKYYITGDYTDEAIELKKRKLTFLIAQVDEICHLYKSNKSLIDFEIVRRAFVIGKPFDNMRQQLKEYFGIPTAARAPTHNPVETMKLETYHVTFRIELNSEYHFLSNAKKKDDFTGMVEYLDGCLSGNFRRGMQSEDESPRLKELMVQSKLFEQLHALPLSPNCMPSNINHNPLRALSVKDEKYKREWEDVLGKLDTFCDHTANLGNASYVSNTHENA